MNSGKNISVNEPVLILYFVTKAAPSFDKLRMGTASCVSPDVRKTLYCFIKMALANWLGDWTMNE